MEIGELKKLTNNSTAVLIFENGQPSFVVMDYASYKNLVDERSGEKEVKINNHADAVLSQNVRERETEILEKLNKEILALKNQIEMEEKGMVGQPSQRS